MLGIETISAKAGPFKIYDREKTIIDCCRYRKAAISLQIDLGFSDAVYPEAITFSCPTLLPEETIPLRAYSWETVIAEKFQAIVNYQKRTSRKDVYDSIF